MEYTGEHNNSTAYRVIGATIVFERRKRGMKQDDLLRELQLRGIRIARNKLSAIENGSTENITAGFLLAVCNILECDIGFLFGEYDEKTRELHNIAEYTGLTENAIKSLHGSAKSWRGKGRVKSLTVSNIPKRERRVVDALLTSKTGIDILNYLYSYFFVEYNTFFMHGKDINGKDATLESDTITMHGSDLPVYVVHPDDVEEVIALRVYQSLNELRKEIIKEGAKNG